MQLRVWRLYPGSYRVVLYADPDDDGRGDRALMEKEMQLRRAAYIDLVLPPHMSTALSITPIKTSRPKLDKPDPAISRGTVELVYGEHLVVKVYNLGTRPVENLVVRVRDGRSGAVLPMGEQVIEKIEAPLDLKPKYKAVEVKNVNCNTYGRIIVELDPSGKIDDLNPYNNRVVIEY